MLLYVGLPMSSVGFGSNINQAPFSIPQAHVERLLLKYYRTGTLINYLLASFFVLSSSMIPHANFVHGSVKWMGVDGIQQIHPSTGT